MTFLKTETSRRARPGDRLHGHRPPRHAGDGGRRPRRRLLVSRRPPAADHGGRRGARGRAGPSERHGPGRRRSQSEYADKNGGGPDSASFSATVVANDTVDGDGLARRRPGSSPRSSGSTRSPSERRRRARWARSRRARGRARSAVDAQHPELQCDPAPCSNDPTVLDLDKVGAGRLPPDQRRRLARAARRRSTLADWIVNGSPGRHGARPVLLRPGRQVQLGPS